MTFKKVGVVGAGMMGAEIALCFARKGMQAILSDVDQARADKGKANVDGILTKLVTKNKLEAAQKDAFLNNIKPTAKLEDMADCDLIVEAVVEVLSVKHDIFAKLDKICKPETILASNTSSISITLLSSVVSKERAPRFLGMHFISPASVMKLVEVIPAQRTDKAISDAIYQLLVDIEKEPVTVKDVVGFAMNRIFHAYTLEAARLVEEGVCTADDVDKIMIHSLGHPVGVMKLMDILGLDLCLKVDEILFEAYGERFRPAANMQRLVAAGMYGRKSGAGFYDYSK
jgi:3-hydroxybutyryl-CoA dehydrogenase